VVEQVRRARRIGTIVVATDDRRIADAVERFGGRAVMTRADHPNGTCRVAEAAAGLGLAGDDIVVNVQGDEPQIEPQVIDELISGLEADGEAPMATLASPFEPDEDPADPNIVKLVVDGRGRALYFSRSCIPFDRDGCGHRPLKHPGLYAYHLEFLQRFVLLEPMPLENAEQLEQLRALEHGHRIAVIQTRVRHHGIDTPQQYEAFVTNVRAGGG